MADAERLRRLAYLMLAPSLGRRRRVVLATAAATAAAATAEPTAALVTQVLHTAGGHTGLVLPGLALLGRPRQNEQGAAAAKELGALYPAARVAYVLTRLEQYSAEQTADMLRAAGVADPETAVLLAEKSPADAAVVRQIEVPDGTPMASRLVMAGVVAGVVAVAVPVIAVAGRGSHSTDTNHQVSTGQPTVTGAPVDTGLSRPLDKASVAPAARPSPASAPTARSTPTPGTTAYELNQLLTQLDQKLAESHDKTDRKQLRKLRDAVAERIAKLPK